LILCNAQARWQGPSAAFGGISQETQRALDLSNPRIGSLALAEEVLGRAFDAPALQWYLRLREESVTGEMFAQVIDAQVFKMDVRDLLPKISVPTLVVHYRNDLMIPFEAGRELAAEIPGARFVPLEDGAHYFYICDTRPLRRAIAEFLGDPVEEVGRPAPRLC
jgi:pimeloyl-ACP methyl ester carboxylesterase